MIAGVDISSGQPPLCDSEVKESISAGREQATELAPLKELDTNQKPMQFVSKIPSLSRRTSVTKATAPMEESKQQALNGIVRT
jgi:hypothetical protein